MRKSQIKVSDSAKGFVSKFDLKPAGVRESGPKQQQQKKMKKKKYSAVKHKGPLGDNAAVTPEQTRRCLACCISTFQIFHVTPVKARGGKREFLTLKKC